MPKPSDYTPARRRMMQLIMVLILAVTIALAAAVARSARRAHWVELSDQAITAKEVTVRLPKGWRTQSGGGGGGGAGAAGAGSTDPGLVAQAIETISSDDDDADADAARTITIRVERLRTPMSPIQYLFSNYEPAITGPRQRRVPEDWLLPIPVAGRSGIMMTAERGPRTRGRSAASVRKEVIATTVLPSLRAVVVHLQGMGEADSSDRAIVKQIAAGITLANEPELGQSGEVVTLVDGIRFTTPRRFAAVPETDPNRTDRRLWPAPAPGRKPGEFEENWQSIETVGCLCPDFDAADPKQVERAKATMATLLLVREPLWRFAEVTSIGKNVWRADLPKQPRGQQGRGDDAGSMMPIRAFFMTDPSGRALLTIVRGGASANDLNEPWNQIAPTVQFLPAADVASLEDIGTSEASGLRRTGYEKLLADRDVEWWLWTSNDAFIGWSNIDFPGAASLAGKKQAHLRLPDGEHISHVVHDFSYRDAGPNYTSTITRDLAGPDGAAQSVQKTTLDAGQLARSFDKGGATTLWPAHPPPPQFVPGALLPLLIGQLSRDPMLLHTDSFPGPEGIGPPQLLSLIIRPGEATSPLRCVTVQVNGAGTISRWYFRKTGELESVEWPGGLKQIASDQNVVKNNFPKESGMAPN